MVVTIKRPRLLDLWLQRIYDTHPSLTNSAGWEKFPADIRLSRIFAEWTKSGWNNRGLV